MAFEATDVNSSHGHTSAHATSIEANPGGVALVGNATGVVSLGTVKAPMPQGKARLVVRASAAYGVGESLVVLLRWQNAAGGTETPALATLDEDTVPAAGEFELATDIDVGKIPPGAVVSLSNTYVAGAGADPNVSFALQLY